MPPVVFQECTGYGCSTGDPFLTVVSFLFLIPWLIVSSISGLFIALGIRYLFPHEIFAASYTQGLVTIPLVLTLGTVIVKLLLQARVQKWVLSVPGPKHSYILISIFAAVVAISSYQFWLEPSFFYNLSDDVRSTAARWKYFAVANALLIGLLIPMLITSRRQLRFFFLAWMGLGLIVALEGLIQYPFGAKLLDPLRLAETQRGSIEVWRLSSFTSGSGPSTAELLYVPTVLSAFIALTSPSPRRWATLVTAVILAVAIILAQGRATYLGLLVSGIAFFFVVTFRLPNAVQSVRAIVRPLMFAGILAVLVLVTASTAATSIGPRFSREGPNVTRLNNIVTRLQTWGGTVEVIKQSPIIGGGLGTAARNFSIVHQEQGLPGGLGRSGHNTYLDWVAETGVLGGMVFAALIIVTIRNLIRVRRRAKAVGDAQFATYSGGLLVAFPGFMVQYIFDSAIQDMMFFFIFLGISFVLLKHQYTALVLPVDDDTIVDGRR